jgi:hypothetical protein
LKKNKPFLNEKNSTPFEKKKKKKKKIFKEILFFKKILKLDQTETKIILIRKTKQN